MPDNLSEYLARADRYIARAKEHLTRQRALITRFVETGHKTHTSEHLLAIMEETLRCYEAHRSMIVEQMNGRPTVIE